MEEVKIKDIKKGEFFTLKPIEYPTDMQVYIKDEYDRSEKKYSCYKYGDVCFSRSFKADKVVYTGFTF